MTFDPNGYEQNLVMLVDIEVARRLDALTWTQAAAPNTACRYVDHPEGAPSKVEANGAALTVGTEYKTDDAPATRGTEWNLDTHEFVSSAAFAGEADRRNGCLSAGLLILHNETTGKFDGYSTTTGLLVRSTAAHNFSSVEGLCADGTYFYATGTKVAPGNERVVYKYLISDFSFIDSWEPAWPTYQGPFGIKYNGGYVFAYDARTEKIFKIDVSDMTLSATLSVPFYDGSHVYSILDFDLDSAGAYIYTIAVAGPGDIKCRKFSASDCSHVADGTDTFGTSAQRIYHYAEGAVERFYVVYNDGSNTATKINPATLDKYYAGVTTLAHTPLGIAADENYLYAFFEDQGVDRYLKNDISSYEHAPSLEGCQAAAQSYFYDSATGRLYVHITGGGTPATAAPYLASYHWRRLGTDAETYDGHLYLPVLPEDSIPNVSAATGRFHEGGTSLSFGAVKVLNGDGRFDALFDTYIWEAKRIKVRIGEKGKGDANYTVIFDGWTGDISWNDDFVEIGTEDLRTLVL